MTYLNKRIKMFVFQNVKAGVNDLWNGLDIQWDTVLDEIARSSANMLSLTNDQASSSVSDQSNIIPTFGRQETLVRSSYYDKFLPLQSKTQIRKKRDGGGGFSIFSLLNFMLVVLNIVIDINNNINNK